VTNPYQWTYNAGPAPVSDGVEGCDECNRTEQKPWPVFTLDFHGVECCGKCLTPIHAKRKKRA
jgi:hypothetical protein